VIYQELTYTDSYGRRIICRKPEDITVPTEYIGLAALLRPTQLGGRTVHKQVPFTFKIGDAIDIAHAFFRFDVERDAAAQKEQAAQSKPKILVPG
jgi:hypothetical protein